MTAMPEKEVPGDDHRHGRAEGSRNAESDDSAAKAIGIAIKMVVEEIIKLFPQKEPSRKPPAVKVLTFGDVVRFFSKEHPGDPRIRAGALLRQPHPSGHLVFQVFLDKDDLVFMGDNASPYGRVLVARSLDDELAAKFADSDLMVFR